MASSKKVRPAADEAKSDLRSRREQSRKTGDSSRSAASADGRASQKERSSSKPKPAPVEEELLDDLRDESIDEFDEYGNAYSEDDAEAEDDWDSPASLPPAQRKRKMQAATKKKRSAGGKLRAC
jgi:hypothetical protein